MQMSLGQWLEILRKLSHQKLDCSKAPSYKIQGMLKGMVHATLQLHMEYI